MQEQLQRQSAETGIPYQELLQQAREQERQSQANSWAQAATPGYPAGGSYPAYQPPPKNNRIWWILGIIAGVGLVVCVICAAIGLIVWQRAGVSLGEGDAGAVVREHLILGTRGQWGAQWDTLHPAHQGAVARDTFVGCGRTSNLTDITVLVEYNEETFVPLLGQTMTRVVTYSATQDGTTIAEAMRVVQTGDNEWRWVMDDVEIEVYQAGRCP